MEPVGGLQKEDKKLVQEKGSVFDDSVFTVKEAGPVEKEKDREEVLSQMEKDLKAAAATGSQKTGAVSKGAVQKDDKKSVNQLVAESVPEFDKKLKRDFNESGFELDVEHYNIKELLDAMESDTNKKHTDFKAMEGALRKLYNLKDDLHTAGNNNTEALTLRDYRDVIRLVESTARLYQVTHDRAHITPYGRKRLKMSIRILDIVSQFRQYANDVVSGRIKDLTERVDDAGIEEIIKEVPISDEEKGKSIGDWLKNGGKYKEVLKKIIKKEKLDQLDRDTFNRIMEDKNRRLIANKTTLSMIIDEIPGITLRLSDLEKELKDHIKKRLDESDDIREKVFSEVDEFRSFVSAIITSFYDDNSKRIEAAKKRKETFVETLKLDKDDVTIFRRSDVNELILKAGEKEFNFRLSILKGQSDDNEELINEVLKSLDYSTLSLDRVRDVIRKDLKDLAVFGGEMDIASAVRDRMQYMRYLCPNEEEAEKKIKNLMESYHIPPIDKEFFARYLAKETGEPKEIAEAGYFELRRRARAYVANLKGSAKKDEEYSYSYRKLKLKEKTWREIEELKLSMGVLEPEEFRKKLQELIENDSKDTKIDLSEPRMSIRLYEETVRAPHPARGIGFSKRILGDLFLEDKEILSILSDEEKEYFKKNLMNSLAPSEERRAELEFLPSSSIRAVADLLKKNLSEHKDHIRVLRGRCDEGIMKEFLLKVATSTKPLDNEDLDDIAWEIGEQHIYDDKMDEEMGLMVKAVSSSTADLSKLNADRLAHFSTLFKHLKTCNKGRYALFAERLVSQPDFYKTFMSFYDEEELDTYLSDVVEKKMGKAFDAISASNAPAGLKDLYLDKKFELIYSGALTGEIINFKLDLMWFQKSFFTESGTDPNKIDNSVNAAIRKVEKELFDRKDRKDVAKVGKLLFCAEELVKELYKTKEGIKILASKNELAEKIRAAYEDYDSTRERLEKEARERAEKQGADAKDSEVKETDEDREKGKEAIAKKVSREIIRIERDQLLGLDAFDDTLSEIYKRKALVTFESGKKNTLSKRDMQLSRDYVASHLSYMKMDPFLIECLAEKNVNRVFRKDIVYHADWLVNISDILSSADEGEDEITEDEKKLLIVNAYRRIDEFKDDEGKFDSRREVIKGDWYREFRKNYRFLKEFESQELSFPSLNEEKAGLSRSLRALLVTDSASSFEEMASDSKKYLSFINEFMKNADKALEKNDRYRKEGKTGREEYLLSLRQYFHNDIMNALKGGDMSFKQDDWDGELTRFAMDDTLMRYICKDAIMESVGSEEYHKKNRLFVEAATGRDKIDKLIEDKGSLSQRRRYKKLKDHEKELFCLGLMLMEKGASGFDRGTVSVLSSQPLRESRVTDRLRELTRYMAGESYDFRVDYSEAYYKLVNRGLGFFGKEKEAFSDTAFNKAMEFTKGIGQKIADSKNAFTAEDKRRIGDGISSIYEAALLGKKQIDEVDELRKKSYTAASVREKLLEYAQSDSKKLGIFGSNKILKDYPDEVLGRLTSDGIKSTRSWALDRENRSRVKVMRRLEKMDDTDTMKLIAILQNRAALDISTKDKSKHADDDRREELRLMFSEDNEERMLQEFSKPSSCLQALFTAISFKVNDTKHLETGRLKKTDFDEESFNRRSTVDWRLLEKAFEFLDELKKESVSRFAVRNAPEYIEASGNTKAIAEYKKLQEQKEVGKDFMEDFLKEQAEADRISKDNKEAKLALAGYNALDERQKRLFVKVLARRDFLDISKKNLYLNMFSSKRERGFMNQTGRFRLIDEYIEKSMRGNEGVALMEDSYRVAIKSLLSTQVDDTVDFGEKDRVKKILAGEKYFLFKRDTAVDWKLFIRALQFVNRASYELEMREGNDELYRAAGRFPEYGKMSMDYGILRRNIHSTGNQFVRYGLRRGKKLVVDQIKSISLTEGLTVEDIAGYVMDATKIISPSLNAKLEDFKDVLSEEEVRRKRNTELLPEILRGDIIENVKGKVKGKVTKALTGTVFTAEEAADVMSGESLAGEILKGNLSVDDLGTAIRKKLLEEPEPVSDKVLDPLISGVKVKSGFGDIRDYINGIVDSYKKGYEIYGKVVKGAGDVQETLDELASDQVVNVIGNLYSEAFSVVLSDISGSPIKGSEIRESLGSIYTDVKSMVDEIAGGLKKGDDVVKEVLSAPGKYMEQLKGMAKDRSLEIIRSFVGQDSFEKISEAYAKTDVIGSTVSAKISFITDRFKKAQVCVECFADIAKSVQNKRLLSRRTEVAESEETKAEDSALLERAKRVQSEIQQKQVEDVVKEHKDLQKMSGKTADTIQSLNIADDVIQVLLEVGEELAEDLGGFKAAGAVKEAIRAGADFALYVIRCMKDRSMLRTYYTETERGSAAVQAIKNGYGLISGSKEEMEAELGDKDVLDIVRQGKGYENLDELVMDTGFKMASSIAYCASKYNPVKQTKIMAVTVMVVLGMKDSVGKTDAATVAGIYDSMKAA